LSGSHPKAPGFAGGYLLNRQISLYKTVSDAARTREERRSGAAELLHIALILRKIGKPNHMSEEI
jgi:hypothetical protein